MYIVHIFFKSEYVTWSFFFKYKETFQGDRNLSLGSVYMQFYDQSKDNVDSIPWKVC